MTDVKQLENSAKELRRLIVDMLEKSKSGHPGGSLSCADLLTVLYFDEMNVDAKNPKKEDRDYFILSKGHAAPALYGVLAQKGYFPKEELDTLRKINTHLQGHPASHKTPGIEISTGSLGQGVSAAAGLAKGLKISNMPNRVYTLLGDGETEEGQVWEAAMFAAHYKLDNLVVIVDRNRLQIDGHTTDVMSPEPLDKKFSAFGFHVIEIDGHDILAIKEAFEIARTVKGHPVCIIANTIKGKGVSFMEDQAGWHGKAPNKEERDAAMAELA